MIRPLFICILVFLTAGSGHFNYKDFCPTLSDVHAVFSEGEEDAIIVKKQSDHARYFKFTKKNKRLKCIDSEFNFVCFRSPLRQFNTEPRFSFTPNSLAHSNYILGSEKRGPPIFS